MEILIVALFLALFNNRLLQFFVAPVFDRWELDKFYLLYISAITGVVLTALAGIRLLLPYGIDIGPWPDVIVSGLIIGGGANLIHDIFDGGGVNVEVDVNAG